jgi:hypothetical protein
MSSKNKKQSANIPLTTMRELKSNVVEDFLRDNKNVKYSVRTLSRKLNVNTRYAYMMLVNSSNVRKCDPIEVGSGKQRVNVFTWEHKK